jgi:hypothetical protein
VSRGALLDECPDILKTPSTVRHGARLRVTP